MAPTRRVSKAFITRAPGPLLLTSRVKSPSRDSTAGEPLNRAKHDAPALTGVLVLRRDRDDARPDHAVAEHGPRTHVAVELGGCPRAERKSDRERLDAVVEEGSAAPGVVRQGRCRRRGAWGPLQGGRFARPREQHDREHRREPPRRPLRRLGVEVRRHVRNGSREGARPRANPARGAKIAPS